MVINTKLNSCGIGVALVLALPAFAQAQGFQAARNSTDLSGLNTNNGFYNDLGGLLNTANGNVISTTGQNNVANGGYHAFDGANMTSSPNSFFNVTHGFNNQSMGSVQWVGGQNNVATGIGTYIYGTLMDDNGLPGNVMFTDYNPRGNRNGGGIGPATGHQFTALFHGGHYMMVDDQNFMNGLAVVPSDATLTNGRIGDDGPAFVGVNTGLGPVQGGSTIGPRAALHVNSPLQNGAAGGGQDNAFIVTKGANTIAAPGLVLLVRTFGAALPFNLELFEGNAFKPGGGAWGVVSDGRLKKDVEEIDGALDKLLKLRPVSYEYIDPEASHQLPGRQTGLIAQEVEEVFPEWVTETAEGYKAVTIRGFEALAVQALHELRDENTAALAEKDKEIAELGAKLERLEVLEAKMAALESKLD